MAKKIARLPAKSKTALKKIITVKNADGDPDTTATIVIQNKIKYTPKVSVIIPVYNVEQYLRECLDSVVNQTLREIEIICVDDGSTDSSLDILKEYASKDKRITVIGQQNLHAGVARNAGLAVARGEYLSFLDSDDFFETNMFEKMYNKAIETSAEICTCHVRIYNMSKNTYENCSWGLHDDLIPAKQPFAAKDIYEKIYQFNQGWVWDKIYKKSFVQKNKVRFQSQRSSNDVFFCFCNLTLATKIIVIPDALVTHRLHVKGSLENTREKSYFNIVNAVTKIKGFLEAKNLYKSVKVSFVNFAISNIIWNYETLKEPIKTFLLEYINKFYKELFNSINKKQYFNQANYEKMQNLLNKRHMGNPADYIPVVLATNKNYCLPCVVTINSIIQNADKTKKYAVFVLHSELDNTDIEHLESMCTDNVFVHCISVDINRLVGNNFDYTTAHYSKEMYYRILIADMFGIYNKVIYIDCDLVLNTDIANLYQTDLCDNVIAAIINPIIHSTDYIKNTLGVEPEKYFNSGVLIINIKKFKELKIKERCLNLLQEIKSLRFPDQDVLNIACQGSVLYLDIRWNYQWFFKIDNIQLPTYCKEQYDAASSNPYIIHYSSGKKPWKMRNLQYAESWWKYAKGTPAYMFYAKQIDYKQELCDWYFRLKKENLNLRADIILPCIALGTAAFVMQSSESVISVCFNSSLLKYGGDIAVGAMTIMTSVMQFAMLPLQGIAQGAQPITSYNFGAKNAGRVKKTFRLLLITCLTYSIALWAAVMIAPQMFVKIFTSDTSLAQFAAPMLRIYLGGLGLFGIQIACQMTFTSLGKAANSIVVAVVRKFVLLLPLIYIMPSLLADKTQAVYMAEPVADIIAVTFTAILFTFQFKKALKEITEV